MSIIILLYLACRLFCLRRASRDELEYWVHPASPNEDTDAATLHDYFRLDHSLRSLYKQWATTDTNFALKSASCHGVRLLNQHPLESLVAFICSSNNNIQRIHSMMTQLAEAFGTHLGCHGDQDYYTFPSLLSLCAEGVEHQLRGLGFGYRAKYVHQTALKLSHELGGEKWLEDLKKLPYQGMCMHMHTSLSLTQILFHCVFAYRCMAVTPTVSWGWWESGGLCLFDGSRSHDCRTSGCACVSPGPS